MIQQTEAVPAADLLRADQLVGPVRVLAGPGGGKTRLLVDLYVDLVRAGRAARDRILVLTFSTAAADEIARRVDARLLDSYPASWISTFHSFCARLLREHRPDPGRLLMSGYQEWLAMRAVLADLAAQGGPEGAAELGPLAAVAGTDVFAQDAIAFVAMLKQNQVHPARFALLAEAGGSARVRALAAVYAAYQRRCDAARLRDFPDLVADSIALLEARPSLLSELRQRFQYVLVDEFQDVDPAQFELLQVLASPAARPRLLVAGDPDQSIYAFRGTVPRLLAEEFSRIYGARTVHLRGSHRCPEAHLAAGRRLLAATQPGREIESVATLISDPEVRVSRHPDSAGEAIHVAREIRRLLLEDPTLAPSQVAVLLRSTITRAAPFEDALRALAVPHEVRGLGGLARNEVVRFLLAYLGALHSPDAPPALEGVLGSSLGGVDQRTAGRLRRYSLEEGRPLRRVVSWLLRWLAQEDPEAFPLPWSDGAEREGEVPAPPFAEWMSDAERHSFHASQAAFHALRRRARSLSLHGLAYAVLMEAGVMRRLLELELPRAERDEALADLRATLDAFAQLDEVWTRIHGRPPSLDDVAEELERLLARAIDDVQPAARRRDAVQVMTVHQAKGLEFRAVFLCAFAENDFPPAARPHPVLEEADQRWLEKGLEGFSPSWPVGPAEHQAEEARVAYVGLTRSLQDLWVTFADRYDGPAGPSPFLEPALPLAIESPDPGALVLSAGAVLTRAEAESLLAGAALGPADRERLAALRVDLRFLADPDSGRPFEPYLARPQPVEVGHFSPTSLNDYLKCPRLYWYNHHPGLVAAERGPELERGSFLHEVLEEFHRREPEWRSLPPEAQREWLLAVLEPRLDAYLQRQEAALARRAEEREVRRILDNYIRFSTTGTAAIRRFGTLGVERRFTLDLDGAEIHGKIDRINDTGGGTCEVVDYKTGRGKTPRQAYADYFGEDPVDVQLLMYDLACREGRDEEGNQLGLRPRFLSLWYPKEQRYGQMRQVLFAVGEPAPAVSEWIQRPLSAEDLDTGRAVVTRAMRRIREGDFAPAPRDAIGTCRSWFGCPHAPICPFGGTPQE
ncbi:MAG: ATP-dependent helicase [Candidatus Dormibacteraeota bacterium]|nr:ATP-dependent helicase [Candidatus Dormibacteraeota bacterium]